MLLPNVVLLQFATDGLERINTALDELVAESAPAEASPSVSFLRRLDEVVALCDEVAKSLLDVAVDGNCVTR